MEKELNFGVSDEEMEKYDFYKDLQNDPNNFSYWFPHIKNVEGFEIPESLIISVPREICKAYFMDKPARDQDIIADFVKNTVLPRCREAGMLGMCVVKNGTFSDKYDASLMHKCIGDEWLRLSADISLMNYNAASFDAGGITELVIRRDVLWQYSFKCPKIYNGLPLLNEYRVFYDFDIHKPLYIVNYWNYDYCYKTISDNDISDGIVFKHFSEPLQKHYEEMKENVIEATKVALKNVDMTGKWSVDIMERPDGKLFLIDMAVAERSAYWDIEKCN